MTMATAVKYHINPSTGDVNPCSAEIQCRFGSSDHFADENGARKEYERRMKNTLLYSLQGISSQIHKETLVLSDIDGTLLKKSLVLTSAVELHNEGKINLGDLPRRWLKDVKNEKLIYELATRYKEEIKGMTLEEIHPDETVDRILKNPNEVYSSLKRLRAFKKQGAEVFLISGSPDYLVKPFAERFGMKFRSSAYKFDDRGVFTGEIDLMARADEKSRAVSEIDSSKFKKVIGFGDTSSDYPLLIDNEHSIVVEPTDETIFNLSNNRVSIGEVLAV